MIKELEEEKEEQDRRLEKRVQKILENDRKLHKEEIRVRDQEIKDLNEALIQFKVESERVRKDQSGLKDELR